MSGYVNFNQWSYDQGKFLPFVLAVLFVDAPVVGIGVASAKGRMIDGRRYVNFIVINVVSSESSLRVQKKVLWLVCACEHAMC